MGLVRYITDESSAITSFTGRYCFLSNFWPVQIDYEGLVYPSVEHAYQAAKFNSTDRRMRILLLPAPGLAKTTVRNWKPSPGFFSNRLQIMEELVRQKFLYPTLGNSLLSTNYVELIEGNSWGDTFWGVSGGVGQNHLGKILMKIREEIRG